MTDVFNSFKIRMWKASIEAVVFIEAILRITTFALKYKI